MFRSPGRLIKIPATRAWLVVAASCAAAADGVDVSPADGGSLQPLVVARVGESPIMRATLEAALGRVGYDRLGTDELKERASADVLGQLIDEQMLRQAIEREGQTATEAEIDSFLSQLETRLAPGRVSLDQFLARSGRDEKMLRSHVSLEIGVNKLLAAMITREAIEAAYKEHRKELDGTLVRVSHIVLRPDAALGEDAVKKMIEKASSIRSEILQGSLTFDEAARLHSAGPSRRQGGDVGFLTRTGVMVEEFSRQVFSLRKGEISKPFATPFGVHIATVTAIKPGTVGDEKIRPQIEKLAAQKLLREILDRERAGTAIVYGPGVAHFERDKSDPSAPPKLVVEPLPVGQ